MANIRGYRSPVDGDLPDVAEWVDRLAQDVAVDVDALDIEVKEATRVSQAAGAAAAGAIAPTVEAVASVLRDPESAAVEQLRTAVSDYNTLQVPPMVAAAIAADSAPATAAAAAVDQALSDHGTVGNMVQDRGQWSAAASYARDDLVTFAGARWAAKSTPSQTTTTTRTQYIPNPRFANNRAGWSAGTDVTATVTGTTVTLTLNAEKAIGTSLFLLSADVPAVPGETWSGKFTVAVPAGAAAAAAIRPVLNQYPGPTGTFGATETVTPGASGTPKVEGVTIAAAKTGLRLVIQAGATLPAGTILEVTLPLLEKAATAGAYFHGDTADTSTTTYAWSGAVDASASTATTTTTTDIDRGAPGSGDWSLLTARPGPTRTTAAAAMDFGAPSQALRYPGTINRSRTRMWSYQAAPFAITYDDANTWEVINTFAHPVRSVRALDNGEVIVSIRSSDGLQPHELWLSAGMEVNPLTATWTKVMTGQTAGNGPANGWSWSVHGPVIVVGDYGLKGGANNARHVYLSTDYGRTWRVIYDLGTGTGQHIHGVCYDAYWDRIWVSFGDDTNGIIYSDDMGETWHTANFGATPGAPWQAVGIIALPDAVLFGSDGQPNGIWRIGRDQGKHQGTYDMETAYQINTATTITHLCHYIHRATRPGDDAPAVFVFGPETVEGRSLVIMTRDGYEFTQLWEDPLVTPAGRGLNVGIGPTARGQLILNSNDGRQASGMTRWAAPFAAAY